MSLKGQCHYNDKEFSIASIVVEDGTTEEGSLVLTRERSDTSFSTQSNQSKMRESIQLQLLGRSTTRSEEIRKIRASRGAFKFLPVYLSNDLVYGSWWMVWGSLFGTIVCIVPLLDQSLHFFTIEAHSSLQAFNSSATWMLCIISGFFFTIGSWIFLRSLQRDDQELPLTPLFPNIYHLQTDELLGAWTLLLAIAPMVPYSALFLHSDVTNAIYWCTLLLSLLFTALSGLFVYCCYPSNSQSLKRHEREIILPFCINCILFLSPSLLSYLQHRSDLLLKHMQTDWLIATWINFYATLFCLISSFFFLCFAENDRQIFIWITSVIDSFMFLVGSMYHVAGSYPPEITDSNDSNENNSNCNNNPLCSNPITNQH